MSMRLKCPNLGCKECSKGKEVGKTEKGDILYSCKAFKAEHRRISALSCQSFRCKDYKQQHYCKNCGRGK